MTDTSQASFAFVPATTFGATPATPAFNNLRITGETLSAQFESIISNEIRADSTVSEVRRSGISASGDINFELHRSAFFEDMLAASIRGTWATNVLKAGVAQPHFTFERKIEAGTTDYYLRFEGGRIGGLSLSIAPEEYITGSFKAMATGHSATAAIIAGATYPAVTGVNGAPMTGVDVSTLTLASAAGTEFLGLTIDVDLALRMQRKIGQQAARGIGYGRRQITGTLRVYFEDLTQYNLLLANTVTSVVATATDGTNSYTITLPRIRLTGGEVPNPGNDQDFILTMNYQATYDTTLQTDMQITRA